ncbi:MAG TPA: HAD family phosphatase [Firmicutes bacterium]|jgi:Cof subfamily protein (haloacid dehalogenase superfamily)|nr:HAD family phosphatase [Bacillota bacterium]HHV07269.1 HAD family phosphatase [Bacillota bacterium]
MTTSHYRLLVLDLDGTLLDHKSQLSPVTEAAVKKAMAQGLKVTFATGRLFGDALPYAKRLGLTLPLILNHGALLQTLAGEVLASWQIDSISAQALVAIARQTGCACQLYSKGQLYLEKLAPWNKEYLKYSFTSPKLIPDLTAVAAHGPEQIDFLGEPEELKQVRQIIEKELGAAIQPTSSYHHLLEILPPKVSKGRALEYLSNYLQIPLSHTVAVGDGYNDLEMILAAGLGVAMGNAPQEVRHQADYVTTPNNKNGLAQFLDQLLSNTESNTKVG